MIVCRTIPIYDSDVYLCTNLAEGKAFIRSKSVTKDEDTNLDDCRGICYTLNAEGKAHWMMCVFEGGLPIIVHESVHMAWMVLKHCGVRVSQTNDEPLAYLTSWLVQEMLNLTTGAAPRLDH